MGLLSYYQKNLQGTSFRDSQSPTLYISAFTAAPTQSGGGTEVSGSGYVRKSVTNNSTNFSVSSQGLYTNLIDITFAAASGGSWGTITAIGIHDALSAGNLLGYHVLTTPETINDTNQLNIPVGNLDIQF